MQHTDAEELARARLAYVSAGRPGLGAPRRALPQPAEEQPPSRQEARDELLDEPKGWPKGWARLTRKHLVVVAVLLLCGVGVAVAALGRSAATEVPIEPVTVSASAPEPTPTPEVVLLRVHVAGAVVSPGVVTLPEGTIVQDAIRAAGGLSDGADPAQLNLAAPVADGMQILIGTQAEPKGEVVGAEPAAPGGGTGGGGGPVNLNTAGQVELEALPGVGPVMAQAILEWREQNGPFTAVEELQEISGIGPKTFDKLRPLVGV